MDFYPSAFVQPDINQSENENDGTEDGSPESVEENTIEDSKDKEPVELCRLTTPNASLSVSSSSRSLSHTSSSSTSEYRHHSWEVSLADFKSLNNSVDYNRDVPQQKLVAVIGRDFDTPVETANMLQKHFKTHGEFFSSTDHPKLKFLGYEVRRRELISNRFGIGDIQSHDLIAMCYNASEARLLLTGADGFYSNLLKQIERMLGINKAVFLVYKFHSTRQPVSAPTPIIQPALKQCLQTQEALRPYLDSDQVLSWVDNPSELHFEKLSLLAHQKPSPLSFGYTDSCNLL